MLFVYKFKIFVKTGDCGNGILQWTREAHYHEGGSAGGDGGKGGNVIIVVDEKIISLFIYDINKNCCSKWTIKKLFWQR